MKIKKIKQKWGMDKMKALKKLIFQFKKRGKL